jgi:nitrilase
MKKIAVVQSSPKFLNKQASIELAVQLISEAADNDAKLVVFTEAFIPGYPTWLWRLRPGGDWNISEAIYKELLTNAVQTDSEDLAPIQTVAKERQVTVVCGIEERDNALSQATLYNTVIVIGEDGSFLNKHRKLMPTNPERMVWGFGDASGLKVVDTPVGRVGALLCWENFMPLARYAIYAQNVELYIAPTYDSGDAWLGSMQHIAREGRCYVIGCGNLMKGSDFPKDMPELVNLYPDPEEWVNPGDSVVIAPGGEIVSGPIRKESGILYADIDLNNVAVSRRALDVVGHYARPDIFTLKVNNQKQVPVEFSKPA